MSLFWVFTNNTLHLFFHLWFFILYVISYVSNKGIKFMTLVHMRSLLLRAYSFASFIFLFLFVLIKTVWLRYKRLAWSNNEKRRLFLLDWQLSVCMLFLLRLVWVFLFLISDGCRRRTWQWRLVVVICILVILTLHAVGSITGNGQSLFHIFCFSTTIRWTILLDCPI